ncbi:phage major tail tube protein [Candidatus Tokpelaia sp.]|uniref:phage major tail tube protein n=1 Tax=Candidatus Tokpelaia sp. TaxID=2233777 RepID=UPI00123849DA|nr:phage major tail tube protein [Candidatus Tokpelaia sp.]KAA6405675.1 phage tail protein [Candidatus Tokpelaia sp.]
MSLRIIRGCTLIVNDDANLFLNIDTLKLPSLEETTETFQPAGSDMEVDIAGLGVKAFTLQMKLKSHSSGIVGLFGGAPGHRDHFTGKKYIVDEETGQEHEHAIDVTGRFTKIDVEEMAGGKASGYDHEIKSIFEYTEFWDGKVLHRFSFKRGGWLIRGGNEIGVRRRQILGI